MKTDQLALIGDAVIDVVKQRLPELVLDAVRVNLQNAVVALTRETMREREPIIIADAVASTMAAHEGRLGEFRRLDETVLANMREELNRLRVEFDDGLQKHYAEVRRELSHETAVTIATALMDRMQGPQGPPGRDGTLAAVIHWNQGAHVAAGSTVQHRGGLWYANVNTDIRPGDPCSGYTLSVDGIDTVGIETDENGFLFWVVRYASERVERSPMNYRFPQDAGVYDGERDYLPNDIVTCGGSLWIARAANFGRRPGTDLGGPFWRLSVKGGKDGRDGKDGAPGERGPPGVSATPKRQIGANGGAA